ncbi:AAEL015417-PA [Aedes aegypti]|uniref:AAEL015417-PA n=1 Tax=Aedes aegypti TaxID=7159 RepID=Q1DGY8_AEDAE|nr:AAEL015417-PA [Aedes aegypti]
MVQIFGAVSLLLILLSIVLADEVSYKNYKIYNVHTKTHADLELLHRLRNDLDLDFWSPAALNRNSSVMVNPWNDGLFRELLTKNDVEHRLTHSDVESLMNQKSAENRINSRRRRNTKQDDTIAKFDHFWTLDEIYQYLDDLKQKYPHLVRVKDYGVTHEGRPIKVITISTTGVVDEFHPAVLIDGGIHAREWAGHMSVVYLIHQLVERSAENMELLNSTNWVIMPVANPDGYVYTHESNRLWRKNRAPANTVCIGTDLNRNFPFQWAFYGGVSICLVFNFSNIALLCPSR